MKKKSNKFGQYAQSQSTYRLAVSNKAAFLSWYDICLTEELLPKIVEQNLIA